MTGGTVSASVQARPGWIKAEAMVPMVGLVEGSRRLVQHLPAAVLMTAAVLLIPPLVVYLAVTLGVTDDFVLLACLAIGGSLAVGYAGRALWERRRSSEVILFGDLMLWRWISRWWALRRLNDVVTRLGIDPHAVTDDGLRQLDLPELRALASTLESRDPYTHGHSGRVARYATMIAKQLSLPDREIATIRTAAAVHDVGKLQTPLEVLNKPGQLTDEEFDLIKEHAPNGAAMVRSLGDPELTAIVAHHHERVDGAGYPDGLAGQQIPLGARIIAVADTFDALTSTRSYRPAKAQREALKIVRKVSGTQLDPLAVKAFERSLSSPLNSWIAWPLFVTLPHRLWAPAGAQASSAVGGSVAIKSASVAATMAVAVTTGATSAPDSAGARTGANQEPSAVAVLGETEGEQRAKHERRGSEADGDGSAKQEGARRRQGKLALADRGRREPEKGSRSPTDAPAGESNGGLREDRGETTHDDRAPADRQGDPPTGPSGKPAEPGHSGDGPGESPGDGSGNAPKSPPGKPAEPGHPDKGPGKPEAPGIDRGAGPPSVPPGKPAIPGNLDTAPGPPTDPGNGRGLGPPSPPGKPEVPGNLGKGPATGVAGPRAARNVGHVSGHTTSPNEPQPYGEVR